MPAWITDSSSLLNSRSLSSLHFISCPSFASLCHSFDSIFSEFIASSTNFFFLNSRNSSKSLPYFRTRADLTPQLQQKIQNVSHPAPIAAPVADDGTGAAEWSGWGSGAKGWKRDNFAATDSNKANVVVAADKLGSELWGGWGTGAKGWKRDDTGSGEWSGWGSGAKGWKRDDHEVRSVDVEPTATDDSVGSQQWGGWGTGAKGWKRDETGSGEWSGWGSGAKGWRRDDGDNGVAADVEAISTSDDVGSQQWGGWGTGAKGWKREELALDQ